MRRIYTHSHWIYFYYYLFQRTCFLFFCFVFLCIFFCVLISPVSAFVSLFISFYNLCLFHLFNVLLCGYCSHLLVRGFSVLFLSFFIFFLFSHIYERTIYPTCNLHSGFFFDAIFCPDLNSWDALIEPRSEHGFTLFIVWLFFFSFSFEFIISFHTSITNAHECGFHFDSLWRLNLLCLLRPLLLFCCCCCFLLLRETRFLAEFR